ncbi:MAG: cation transporter, partial [Acidimicrobiales bacterium]
MTITDKELTHPAPAATEVTLALGGMTCGACAARIERRLNDLEGVDARVNYAAERATVTLSAAVAAQRLVEEVTAAGYSARVLVDHVAPDPETGQDLDRRVRSLGRRLVVAAVLFMPLCDVSIAFWLVPTLRFTGWQWLALALAAPVVLWAAWPFYLAAARAARHRTTTMDTLVSIGIVASTAWSIDAMFWRDTGHTARSIFFVLAHGSAGGIYLDVAAGVTTFILAGRYFEASSKRRAGNALRALAAVGAKEVGILDTNGFERRRPVGELGVGDRFVVRPGETVA